MRSVVMLVNFSSAGANVFAPSSPNSEPKAGCVPRLISPPPREGEDGQRPRSNGKKKVCNGLAALSSCRW
eukprot:2611004-Rhodomonas_salina.3